MEYLVSPGIGGFSFGRTVLATVRLSTCFLLTFLLAQVALAAPADDFVTTWKTNNPGTSNSTSITVPMIGGPYDVDWNNDGVFDQFGITDSVTHDFGVAGTYKIRIFGSYESIRFADGGDKLKILSLDQWGTGSWTSMERAFLGAANLLVPATDTPIFSAVTNMNAMFWNAAQANPDTSSWNTSSVKSMSGMFSGAISADPDTGGWVTSSVEDMSEMFFNATSANPDTSGWDTSSVTNMFGMFRNATSANPDTGGWDISSVVQMGSMFYNATSANPDTGGWVTSSVEDMSYMFYNATSANPDTGDWDTSLVEDMSYMFYNATVANPDTSGWDVSAVQDTYSMFQGAASANPDTSGWNTLSVRDMSGMFQDAISFDRDIGSWDVTALEDATGMFAGVTLSTINYENLLIGWDNQALNADVRFSGGNSTYCSAQAAAARANMIASDFWEITDGGQACPPAAPNLAPDLTPESDTGISDSDDFTTDNTPDFYVECSAIGHTVTLYSDNPTAKTVLGSHLCLTAGVETAAVTNALRAGLHNVTYTYTNVDGESGHSPSLAVTIDLIFSDGFEDAPK